MRGSFDVARKERRSAGQGRPPKAGKTPAGDRPGSVCAACGTPARPDAKFCHQCGARLGGGSRFGLSDALPVVLLAGLVALVFAAVVGLAYLLHPDLFRGPQTVSRAPATSTAPASSVDLSRMSPREAADRLFNRIMAAQETGDLEEARRFAPMAVQAYDRVAKLDADAHYHLGLIYGVMDDDANVRRQIAALREIAPNHLLAFALEYELAQKRGDAAAAARAAAGLNAAYESEMAAGRPEYEAHGFSIERVREAAGG